jgi:hypothetical protein
MNNKPGQSVWNVSTILSAILCIFFAIALPISGSAQSLNPKSPTPLAAGENRGTLDCMVGPHYWSFKYKKGSGKITVNFTSMGLFGNPQTTTIEVVLHASNGQVVQSRSLTSRGTVAQLVMPGTFPGPGTAYIELRTQGPCLVRAGGDYTIAVSGDAIDFGGTSSAARTDPIVGTYAMMVYPPDFDFSHTISFHFSADGTVRATDGHRGTWKVFDPDAMIYEVVVGRHRWSLKLVPGRGLADTSDVSTIVFQAVR